MASPPVLHILDKANYSKHRLVTLPSDHLPLLAPSSLRLQTKILGLTTNNFAYAQLGHVLGWWDTYPQPTNTPAPYNDRATYGRISAWGYAEIIESTVPGIAVGKTVYGFLPIATLPEDVTVEKTGLKNQIRVTNPHRQHLWIIYNRYQICPPLDELERTKTLDFLGWDSLMQGLFATSYNMNCYGFAWTDENRIHPGGEGEWTAADANLADATVIVLSASGKTGVSFAHQLRHNRPKQHQPRAVIGVCSITSKSLVENTGFYDKVVLYTDDKSTKEEIAKQTPHRTVIVDFGAREGAGAAWNNTFKGLSAPNTYALVGVGGVTKPQNPEDSSAFLAKFDGVAFVNASKLREKGIALAADKYFEEFYARYDEFKAAGGVPGVQLKWGEGLKAWEQGWEALCQDQVSANTGLVYRI
ncbi:hypothetical protein BDV95DRAFT_555785 [Massariosphaeria phaeospora]|uniref:Uncharacterized protein n=1 Tax=Massariosphaeria phaeospora TaxID=100035 RepID=A0A7C8I0I5_9PLEO|nr:hypothetical protein BDV95DRAFT_555785 [Massariosphaeria phaeospora]